MFLATPGHTPENSGDSGAPDLFPLKISVYTVFWGTGIKKHQISFGPVSKNGNSSRKTSHSVVFGGTKNRGSFYKFGVY